MKKLLKSFLLYSLFAGISGSFISCVTLFCHKNATINIRSDKGAVMVIDTTRFIDIESETPFIPLAKTDTTYPIPHHGVNITVARSQTVLLPITIRKDSVRKTVYLKPRHSKAYYCNFLSYGLGFLADFKNPNRFAYPYKIYINTNDTGDKLYHRFAPWQRCDITLNMSVPYINIFTFNDGKNSFSQGGFWGISCGVNNYYASRKSLSLQLGTAVNLPIPVPAAIDYFGDTVVRSNISSTFLNLKNNYTTRRYEFGYGLSVSHNTWREFRTIRDSSNHYKTDTLRNYNNTSIGAAFSAYYRLGRNFHIGFLYQPYLFSLQKAPLFNYEHTISFDLVWRFQI